MKNNVMRIHQYDNKEDGLVESRVQGEEEVTSAINPATTSSVVTCCNNDLAVLLRYVVFRENVLRFNCPTLSHFAMFVLRQLSPKDGPKDEVGIYIFFSVNMLFG